MFIKNFVFMLNQINKPFAIYSLSGINLGAKQACNTRGVTTNPPKKNLIPRFEVRVRGGENVITFRKYEITQKITRLRILNHTGI